MNKIQVVLIAAGCMLLIAIGAAGAFTLASSSHRKEIVALQNEVAKRDQTIETQKGLFERLTLQSHDLSILLDEKDGQLKVLQKQLADSGSQLLTANTLIVKLKKRLEAQSHGTVDPVDPNRPEIVAGSVDTGTAFSPFKVTAEVSTNCKTRSFDAMLHLDQIRPLRLSVIVSQDKSGTWKTSTTSSEDAFQIDIALSGVNPYMLESKWYEKIGLHADLGVGSGVLLGFGASYKIGKFTVGPTVWGTMNWDLAPKGYIGATMGWNPFQRD
jgi:hypothetical protein